MKIKSQLEIVDMIVENCRHYELDDLGVECVLMNIEHQVKQKIGIVDS